ncbi:UNVERIFIED_CONTAM: tRNA (guanine(9)-N1)-methyltransferase [Sesamum latifolium]|uniref:tRNA (guanine(9)-N(1))-methyltransferase n=1 Tax=Sesamum latifolium TaxID=2727402 RepID=A0AAW2VCN0_9LAMI
MESLQNDNNNPKMKNAQKRLLSAALRGEESGEEDSDEGAQEEGGRAQTEEWPEKLASVGEEEREKLIEERKELRKEHMEKHTEERGKKIERLQETRINDQNIVIDLEFSHLMNNNELHSLVQQKEKLVYLTADSETILDELDRKAVYITGGLVDRNRWKGITMEKAKEQGIKNAKLPIGAYLKMSSSQVLTVNHVVEILLKFFETKDWKDLFSQGDEIMPGRQEGAEADNGNDKDGQKIRKLEEEDDVLIDDQMAKRQCIEA